MRETTLCYIENNDSYLMLHRTVKKSDGSYDKWLGVGGKLEQGETPEQCILREVTEETGLMLTDYEYRGKVYFYSDTWEDEIMHLYTATGYKGIISSCNEGELEWVSKNMIMNLKIWEGDKLFLNKLISGADYFELELRYEGDKLVSHKWLEEVFDIVDDKGDPTGQTVSRKDAHKLGIPHRTSHIWLIRKHEDKIQVLLQKRSMSKDSHPGCYDISSAGHIKAGFSYEESAIRELSEELGISADITDLINIGTIRSYRESLAHNQAFKDNQISRVFVLWCDQDAESFSIQKEELSEVVWMELNECMQHVGDNDIPHCMRLNELELIRDYTNGPDTIYPPASCCKDCKGRCCASNGCSLAPIDMVKALNGQTADEEHILGLLEHGNYAIDSFGLMGERIFFLRMRHKCFTFIGIDACGECQALTENGCSLSYDERPKGGRYLEAVSPGQCKQHYDQYMMANDWRPYRSILKKIWDKYEKIFTEDGTFDRCEEDYMNYQRKLWERK